MDFFMNSKVIYSDSKFAKIRAPPIYLYLEFKGAGSHQQQTKKQSLKRMIYYSLHSV